MAPFPLQQLQIKRTTKAEAYFQLGLTYQAMGEHHQAEEYKAKALELFAQMEAPKQIERVTAVVDQTRHKKGRRAKPRNWFYILICGRFESKLL